MKATITIGLLLTLGLSIASCNTLDPKSSDKEAFKDVKNQIKKSAYAQCKHHTFLSISYLKCIDKVKKNKND